MANPRYNTQVTNQRGGSARVGKMGGGMMRPMYKKGGSVKKEKGAEIGGEAGFKFMNEKGGSVKKRGRDFMSASASDKRKIAGRGGGADSGKAGEARSKAGVQEVRIKKFIKNVGKKLRVKKMAGGRIAGAARRAQEHGYYTPDMGMKGGKMFRDGGKVGKKKPRVKVIGIGKAKDYPGIKKIIEMNKKGKKRFKDGGSAMKPVDKSKNPGLAKLPTQVRNKMGYMKKGGRVHKNTSRMNRLEELGRVDAERGFTKKGKKNLKAEKKRIVGELKK